MALASLRPPSLSRRAAWSVAVSALVLLSLGAPSLASAQNDFSAAERERLQRGELVTRPATRRTGAQVTFGGTSYQVVQAPLREVWRMISDPNRYREMLPQVHSARQVARSGSSRSVSLRHHSGPVDVRYTMNFLYEPGSFTVVFTLDETRPHDIQAGWGFIRLASRGAGSTLVSFGAMVGIDTGVVSAGLRPRLQEWLLKVPLTMKWYIDRHRQTA